MKMSLSKCCLSLLLVYTVFSSRINVLHLDEDYNFPDLLHTKTELCNTLKQKQTESVGVIFIRSAANTQDQILFNQEVKTGEEYGIEYKIKTYEVDSTDVDEQSFLLCIRSLKSAYLTIEPFSPDNLSEAFNKLNDSEESVLFIYEESDVEGHLFAARILSTEDDVKDTPTKGTTEKNAINLRPSGLLGIGVIILFILVLLVFFNLLVNTADFNPRFVKEKMPLGKEY